MGEAILVDIDQEYAQQKAKGCCSNPLAVMQSVKYCRIERDHHNDRQGNRYECRHHYNQCQSMKIK